MPFCWVTAGWSGRFRAETRGPSPELSGKPLLGETCEETASKEERREAMEGNYGKIQISVRSTAPPLSGP